MQDFSKNRKELGIWPLIRSAGRLSFCMSLSHLSQYLGNHKSFETELFPLSFMAQGSAGNRYRKLGRSKVCLSERVFMYTIIEKSNALEGWNSERKKIVFLGCFIAKFLTVQKAPRKENYLSVRYFRFALIMNLLVTAKTLQKIVSSNLAANKGFIKSNKVKNCIYSKHTNPTEYEVIFLLKISISFLST